jgi:hypothetical protein
MKTINCKKCDEPTSVEKEVSKVTCSSCCVLIGTKEAK